MIKIVADKHIPFLKGVLEPFAQISYFPGHDIKNLDLSETDALIIRTRTKCNQDLLKNSGIRSRKLYSCVIVREIVHS